MLSRNCPAWEKTFGVTKAKMEKQGKGWCKESKAWRRLEISIVKEEKLETNMLESMVLKAEEEDISI